MSFELVKLPFGYNELEPYISANTLKFHHTKHQQAYLDKTNELIKGTDLETKSLEDIIKSTAEDSEKTVLFNNAAQVWNHTFFWNSLTPNGGVELPDGKFKDCFNAAFGSMEAFKDAFKQAAVTLFGSGWVWLTATKDGLKITKTKNADTPLARNEVPLITLDVWEHAYYLDYQNRRADFADVFASRLINWSFAASNFEKFTAKQ